MRRKKKRREKRRRKEERLRYERRSATELQTPEAWLSCWTEERSKSWINAEEERRSSFLSSFFPCRKISKEEVKLHWLHSLEGLDLGANPGSCHLTAEQTSGCLEAAGKHSGQKPMGRWRRR